jgi:putative ABC transport system permease protein
MGMAQLKKQNDKVESCVVVGSKMSDDVLGTMKFIPAEMRRRLSNPSAFACYDSDRRKLDLQLGEQCEISGESVYFVGAVPGKQYTVPYLICSIETAEKIIPGLSASHTSYVVARCDSPGDAETIARQIVQRFPDLEAYSRKEMKNKIRNFILRESRSGLIIISVTAFCVAIAIFVTSQTLYSVIVSLKNEFAVLDALGIRMGKLVGFVFWQSIMIGLMASPIAVAMAWLATTLMSRNGLPVDIERPVYPIAAILAGVTSVVSAWISLRSLRQVEPAELLH